MKRIIIAILTLVLCIVSDGQEYLAKIKIDCRSTECLQGLNFKKDETVVVFKPFLSSNNWHVWTSYGAEGCLDTNFFQIIPNKPIFKLKSIPQVLQHEACTEGIKQDFKLINVDYCNLINRITKKDFNALTEFFDLIPKVDAALSEIHSEDTWPIINLFSDSELLAWIKTLDNRRLEQFYNYLKNEFVAYPITRYWEYLNLYYPKSWNILNNI